MEPNQMGPKCNCTHHKMTPLLIVLFGLTFLLRALNVLSDSTAGIIWPIIIILIGAQKVFQGRCNCCNRDA